MSHGQFFENSDLWLIYESYISNIYIFWIRILWRILWECFRPRIFRIRPRKILKIVFLRNAWAKFFFRFQIRKLRKNPRRMISIDIRFILRTPTQNEFSILKGLWRLRMIDVFSKGPKLWPSCSEGSITPKKSEIGCI